MPCWSYPTEKCSGTDFLPNVSPVTGTAAELNLLYRETANQRIWESAFTDHEQTGGLMEWGTKLIIVFNLSALLRGYEIIKESETYFLNCGKLRWGKRWIIFSTIPVIKFFSPVVYKKLVTETDCFLHLCQSGLAGNIVMEICTSRFEVLVFPSRVD